MQAAGISDRNEPTELGAIGRAKPAAGPPSPQRAGVRGKPAGIVVAIFDSRLGGKKPVLPGRAEPIMRWRKLRTLASPSPCPLPRGEGFSSAALTPELRLRNSEPRHTSDTGHRNNSCVKYCHSIQHPSLTSAKGGFDFLAGGCTLAHVQSTSAF